MEKQIKFNGYDFFVNEMGNGEKLLLVHGSVSDSRTWLNCAERLSLKFKVITYSRRFHYPNKKILPGEDYSMSQHVEDLKELIQHYTKEPINLIGHSYGALLCLELASQKPDIVKKMVLAEPPAIRLFVSNIPKPNEIFSLLIKRPETAFGIIKLGAFGLGPATKAAEKGDMNKVLETFGKAVLGKKSFAKMTEERKKTVHQNLIATEFTGSGFLPIYDDKLKMIKCPALLITGENSPNVFKFLINRLDELLPKSFRVSISNASHIIHEDNEEEFVNAVNSFLN